MFLFFSVVSVVDDWSSSRVYQDGWLDDCELTMGTEKKAWVDLLGFSSPFEMRIFLVFLEKFVANACDASQVVGFPTVNKLDLQKLFATLHTVQAMK